MSNDQATVKFGPMSMTLVQTMRKMKEGCLASIVASTLPSKSMGLSRVLALPGVPVKLYLVDLALTAGLDRLYQVSSMYARVLLLLLLADCWTSTGIVEASAASER